MIVDRVATGLTYIARTAGVEKYELLDLIDDATDVRLSPSDFAILFPIIVKVALY